MIYIYIVNVDMPRGPRQCMRAHTLTYADAARSARVSSRMRAHTLTDSEVEE